jgi:hypothetical protein
MKHDDLNDPLLRETLDSALDDTFTRESLNVMLKAARRQHEFRRTRQRVAAVAVLLLIGVSAVRYSQLASRGNGFTDTPVSNNPKIKILTDAELLARFPDRPVALIGSGDNKELLLLQDH